MSGSVVVTTEFLDHGWRKTGRTEEVPGFVFNRWRRGSTVITVAWCSDTEVSHAVVQIGDGPKRRLVLAGLMPLVTGSVEFGRRLRLVPGVQPDRRPVCSVAFSPLSEAA